jgi:hypothetical protein
MGSGATSRYALEYPIETDSVNIPSDMETLANDLDALLFSLSIVGKSANYQATIGQLVQMSGAHTVSSPAAGANVMWGAQNAGSGTAVTVATTTGLLNLPGNYGAASISLPHQGDWAIFVCDGTNHNLIAGSPSIMAAEITSIASTWPPAVNDLTVATGVVTVPVTSPEVKITNNAASSVAITMATAGAVDGQTVIIRFYDYSYAAQAISWVNTENSAITAPTTSNASTTLPLTIGFMFNGGTSKWRCVAVC